MPKSVTLLGEAEGIDGLWRSLPSLDSGGDSAAVVLYLPSRALWPPQPSCWPRLWPFCSPCLRLSLSFPATLPLQSTLKVLRVACCLHSRRLPSWLQSARGRMLRRATASLLFVLLRCNCAGWSCCIQACKNPDPKLCDIHMRRYFSFHSTEAHIPDYFGFFSATCPCINHHPSIRPSL